MALVPAGGVTTATLEGGADAVARLLTGRLTAAHTGIVVVSGNVSLEDLRRVFPGVLRNSRCRLEYEEC